MGKAGKRGGGGVHERELYPGSTPSVAVLYVWGKERWALAVGRGISVTYATLVSLTPHPSPPPLYTQPRSPLSPPPPPLLSSPHPRFTPFPKSYFNHEGRKILLNHFFLVSWIFLWPLLPPPKLPQSPPPISLFLFCPTVFVFHRRKKMSIFR